MKKKAKRAKKKASALKRTRKPGAGRETGKAKYETSSSYRVAQESALPRNYEGLCEEVMLPRLLSSKKAYMSALNAVDRLMAEENPTKAQEDYLDLLAYLVEKYEKKTTPALPVASPTDMLISYCSSHGINAAELGRLLGDDSRSLGSKLLKGQRTPSIAQAKVLAERFHCSSEVFI